MKFLCISLGVLHIVMGLCVGFGLLEPSEFAIACTYGTAGLGLLSMAEKFKR